jgi:hypothetical protein
MYVVVIAIKNGFYDLMRCNAVLCNLIRIVIVCVHTYLSEENAN